MRRAEVSRKTSEVSINVSVNLDGQGAASIKTGIKFFDHVLSTLAKHSLMDLDVKASGDLSHHLVEDVALAVGEAILKAVGEKRGIKRFGSALVPMDDSLARVAVDIGGRGFCVLRMRLNGERVEDMKAEDIRHFFESLAQASKANIHITALYGRNDHHKVEAATKALSVAFREAVALDERRGSEIPSLKGVI